MTDFRTLKIDIDPYREGGTKDISATVAESGRAFGRAVRVFVDVAELLGGDEYTAFLFSGNGVQLHVALDRLPCSPENILLMKRAVYALDALYSTKAECEVDTSLWDPRRIVPLAGTKKKT